MTPLKYRNRPTKHSLAAVALICAALPAHAADPGQPWDAWDKSLGAVALTAEILDWQQTRYIAKHPDLHREKNPALGLHPSVGRVNNYFFGSVMLGVGVAHILPSAYRKAFLASGAILEINMLARNVAIGIPF